MGAGVPDGTTEELTAEGAAEVETGGMTVEVAPVRPVIQFWLTPPHW